MSPEDGNDDRSPESATLQDVLAILETVEDPVVTSADVAESLDCSRETARRKLQTLEEQDRLASRRTAGRVIWWIAEPRHEPPTEIDPDDPFWDLEPGASGETDVSENVDEVLYGDGSPE